jgi:sarcosine oxidase
MFIADQPTEAYYEPEAGYLRPEAAVTAQLALATRLGAEIRLHEPVQRWSTDAHGVSVSTESGTYAAGRLVLCAGAWVGDLFPPARELLTVYRQTLYWWPIRQGYEPLSRMPIFVWDFAAPADDPLHLLGFYGFPAIDGPDGGIKVAAERFDERAVADGCPHAPRPQEAREIYSRYIARHLPWLGSEPLRSTTCLYTMAPRTRFLIDRHPDHDAVTIVSACSGHGFKHSPAIGEAIAQVLLDGASEINLSPFGIASYSRDR